MRVFVYGSLMRGFLLHNEGLCNAMFIDMGATDKLFTMYEGFGYPYVVDEPLTHIKGELYSIPYETLCLLDVIEGYPHHYNRIETEINTPNHSALTAWMYIAASNYAYFIKDKYTIIESGSWRKHLVSQLNEE